MSGLEIRDATCLDPAIISALMSEAFGGAEKASAIGEVWDEAAVARFLSLPGVFGLIATVSGEPAGCLLARRASDEAELLSLLVREPQRRLGRGGALLDAACRRMREAGARRLYLEVGVDNFDACAFYDARGFHRAGLRPNYYRGVSGRSRDALLMVRAL